MIKKIIIGLIILSIFYVIYAHVRAYIWKAEAEEYSADVLREISSPWRLDALTNNASESLKSAGEPKLRIILQKYNEYAGNYKKNSNEDSVCILGSKPVENFKNIYAQCIVIAEFENRELAMDMQLVLEKNYWKINDFRIKSPNK